MLQLLTEPINFMPSTNFFAHNPEDGPFIRDVQVARHMPATKPRNGASRYSPSPTSQWGFTLFTFTNQPAGMAVDRLSSSLPQPYEDVRMYSLLSTITFSVCDDDTPGTNRNLLGFVKTCCFPSLSRHLVVEKILIGLAMFSTVYKCARVAAA